MAETKETKSDKKAGDGFTKYVIDRPSFKPEILTKRDDANPSREIYAGPPVQGYWLNHVSMGVQKDETTEEEREMFAYIVKLTAPCIVANRDGQRQEAKVDDEILVWENAQLRQALPAAAANHPQGVVHMRVTPKYREPMKGKPKQKMWHFDFEFASTPIVPRKSISSGANAIARLLATAPKPPTAYDKKLEDSSVPLLEEEGLAF